MSTVTVQEAYRLAANHHQAGDLASAERIYRQILEVEPRHVEALHRLGVIAHHANRPDLARRWIGRAVELDPRNSAAHANLGEACRKAGCLEEAITSLRHALELEPNMSAAHNNLGIALKDHGELEAAAAEYRAAIDLEPGFAAAHNNLGNLLRELGGLAAAEIEYRRALECQARYPQARNNLGNVLKSQERFEEAIVEYRRAIELQPGYHEAHYNLGNTYKQLGRLDEAVAAYCQALHFKRDYSEAHGNLGIVLAERGQIDEAVAACCHAIQFKPNSAECYNTLAGILLKRRQLDEAVLAYRRALELRPEFEEGWQNLAGALLDQGRVDDAIAAYRRALELCPRQPAIQSNLILACHLQPDRHRELLSREQARWREEFCPPAGRVFPPSPDRRDPERCLRIGYVSPDFRDHVLGRNIAPLFRWHDHTQFEVFCYSGVTTPDPMTGEFQRRADHWRDTTGMSDELLAETVRRDGVDILVDLSQHMSGNRLPVFARHPAPVQVSFAGYPASAGVKEIRYRISDRHLESAASPSASDAPEQVFLLDSFWCYDPCDLDVPVGPPPAEAAGTLTFGCLNHFCKINDAVLILWARLLRTVEDSCLLLSAPPGSCRQRVLEILMAGGVDSRRVTFLEAGPREAYLRAYHRVDIALDPFPYHGHTTSLDALWMGVPVVTLAGPDAVSRAGLSHLSNLGLTDWVACSEEEYIAIAARLAADRCTLAGWRGALRQRMENSVLMDGQRFARNIEAIYRCVWRQLVRE